MLTFLRSRKIIGPSVVCFVLRVRVKKTTYRVLFCKLYVFYKEHFFTTQPQCCLTFLWTELHLSLKCCLTLSWRRPLSYRNQSIDLLRKSMDLFQYDNGLGHKRVNFFFSRASMLLRCCLMHITIIILKHILYWVYLCLGLDSFLSYLWFIFHFQSHFYCYQSYNLNKTVALIFVHCLEYLLFLDDNMDEESE